MKRVTGRALRRLYGPSSRSLVENHLLRSRFAVVRRATHGLANFVNRSSQSEAESDAHHLERLLASGRQIAVSGGPGSQPLPKISLVTPNYNQGRFLEDCFLSIIEQGYPNLELIVLDGGSTDESVEVIRRYEDHLTFWVSEKDGGQAAAINSGLQRSTGEIFNWLNADDRLAPGTLMRCAEAYLADPSAAGWVGGCVRTDESGAIADVIFPNGADRDNIGENWNGRQFYQPSCFLSTRVVKEVGGLDPTLYIALDVDLWLRVLEHGEFRVGPGVWSVAINHEDAKTQHSLERMFLETAKIQETYGFPAGASKRRRSLQGEPLSYSLPESLRRQLRDEREVPEFRLIPPPSRDLCIVGDFRVPDDAADTTFFVESILPSIVRRRWLDVHLLGAGARSLAKSLGLSNVKAHEGLTASTGVLREYRLLVSPRRSPGSSSTGVDLAARSGVPVVTATDGLEAIPLANGVHCFVADEPIEFAEKCNQLLHDPICWSNFSVRARVQSVHEADRARGSLNK